MRKMVGVLFGPPGRGSFNEAGQTAMNRVGATIHWIAAADVAGRITALDQLCAAGADLIIAHGGQGDAPVAAVASRYPNMAFAITQGAHLAGNVACYEVLQEQSAFLAGVLAGAMTATGVVAHLSGERVRPGLKGRAAYAQGVYRAAPNVRLLTTFCGNQHDPALAARVVTAQAAAGADIVFAMIDGGRTGAIDACRARHIAQIGNVLDWTVRAPDVFVASALADSGWGIERAAQTFANGTFAFGQKQIVGLDQPAIVDLVFGERVPAGVRQRVGELAEQLKAGAITLDEDYHGPEFDFELR